MWVSPPTNWEVRAASRDRVEQGGRVMVTVDSAECGVRERVK